MSVTKLEDTEGAKIFIEVEHGQTFGFVYAMFEVPIEHAAGDVQL